MLLPLRAEEKVCGQTMDLGSRSLLHPVFSHHINDSVPTLNLCKLPNDSIGFTISYLRQILQAVLNHNPYWP